jgi:transposase
LFLTFTFLFLCYRQAFLPDIYTYLVQHKINTGSAESIRQSLRRLSYGRRQTEKEEILRMLDLEDDWTLHQYNVSWSFKFLITILSFHCGFVHPCSICSSYIRFVFAFDVYFLRFHSDFRGHADLVQHKINTGSAVPIRQSLRRLSYGRRQTEKEEILRMLDLEDDWTLHLVNLSDCLIGTALPVLILCCTKSAWPKSPLDFEKKYFGALITILTMWFEFLIQCFMVI